MDTKSIQCASCGKAATGNFCSHCGAPLVSTCPACKAAVKPGSRACSQCGASLATPAKKWSLPVIVPWIALGISGIALAVALTSTPEKSGDALPSTAMRFSDSIGVPAVSDSGQPGQPPDLSKMSPREAADRLFNRVMSARENGNMQEALKFAPMAIQAYAQAGELDNDARYHLALIHMTAGDLKSARAQVDRLRKSAPDHLLAYMLEHELGERGGNKDVVARADQAFLAAYDREMATDRVEYQEHQGGIERFRDRIKGKASGKK